MYWLTVHYPPVGGTGSGVSPGVWVPRERTGAFFQLDVGDSVAIYQTKSAPTRQITRSDGSTDRETYERGAGGVVAVAKVVRCGGCVPLARVNPILGNSERYRLRGFGGLRAISGGEFEALVRELERSG